MLMLNSALEAILVYVDRADEAKTSVEAVVPGIVAKALSVRPSTKKAAVGVYNMDNCSVVCVSVELDYYCCYSSERVCVH